MNVEKWLKAHKPNWQQLDDLLKTVDKGGLAALDKQALMDIGRLYRMTSADLSRARAMGLSSEVQTYLNLLVVRAHNQVYHNRQNRFKDMWRFLWFGFPRLVQQNILYVLVAFLLMVVPAALSYREMRMDRDFGYMELLPGQPLVPDEIWRIVEQKKLWTDSGADQAGPMAGLIAANNIKVSFSAFCLGFTAGLGTILVLIFNGMHLGTIFGACSYYGMHGKLLTFVAGHGVIELTAIFIAGGAGLMIGKAMLFPGQKTRSYALRDAAYKGMLLACGCAVMLLIAASIEGFVSPRTDINADVKYTVSAATAILLLLYLFMPRNPSRISEKAS
ncbi:MAG: stage II sporulation protein M [Candidatus Melainabacteria bacterium]|jgi:uncharacterized membrane protein SpoIIM required for sporulation|nr:stage II sporulation protein M [Candidatus Melainabacteria bacterium]MBX9673546.1 stage II sporulation protein M [Candidatus Obscuribacterales bacterium]